MARGIRVLRTGTFKDFSFKLVADTENDRGVFQIFSADGKVHVANLACNNPAEAEIMGAAWADAVRRGQAPEPGPDPEPGPPGQFPEVLRCDGLRPFVTPSGEAKRLVGFDMFPWWPGQNVPSYGGDHYKAMAAKGLTAVRFLLKWADIEPNRGQFHRLDLLDQCVQFAKDAGLYVVFDLPLNDGWNLPPGWTGTGAATGCGNVGGDRQRGIDAIATDGKNLIQTIAKRYKDNPVVAAYDLVGEPWGTNMHACLYGRFFHRLVGWVREVAPDKIIGVEPGWGNGGMGGVNRELTGPNIMHTWHCYYGGGAGAGYNQYDMNAGTQFHAGGSEAYNPALKGDLEAQVNHHFAYAERAGLALMGVGEFGHNWQAGGHVEYYRDLGEIFRRRGLSAFSWLYKLDNSSWDAPRDGAGNWRSYVDQMRVTSQAVRSLMAGFPLTTDLGEPVPADLVDRPRHPPEVMQMMSAKPKRLVPAEPA